MRAVIGIVTLLLISCNSLIANLQREVGTSDLFSFVTKGFKSQTIDPNLLEGKNISLLLFTADQSSQLVLLSADSGSFRKKRLTAAILAFPFPFGVLGLHRLYLGSQPYVPLVYIGTLGGCFGVLPFIDFVVILMDKNPERFLNNPKIFMWNK